MGPCEWPSLYVGLGQSLALGLRQTPEIPALDLLVSRALPEGEGELEQTLVA